MSRARTILPFRAGRFATCRMIALFIMSAIGLGSSQMAFGQRRLPGFGDGQKPRQLSGANGKKKPQKIPGADGAKETRKLPGAKEQQEPRAIPGLGAPGQPRKLGGADATKQPKRALNGANDQTKARRHSVVLDNRASRAMW
jgi:hypothetical protein